MVSRIRRIRRTTQSKKIDRIYKNRNKNRNKDRNKNRNRRSRYRTPYQKKNRKIAQRFFRKIKNVCAIFFIGVCILFLSYQILFGKEIAESKLEKETCMVIKSAIGEEHIPMQQYLVGLLAGSIDLTYDDEVLKAQTILLRSSILRKRENAEDTAEKYLLSEESYSQEYLSVSDMQQLYGKEFDSVYERLRGIVEDTDGVYLSYGGQPILGAFCALSGGNTRSGSDVFQNEAYEYLESVSCEYDVTDADYMKNYYFTWKELQRKFGKNQAESKTENQAENETENRAENRAENRIEGETENKTKNDEENKNEKVTESKTENRAENETENRTENRNKNKTDSIKRKKISIISTDESGYVTQIQVGDEKMSGEEFRERLHLNSSHIEIKELEAGIQIQTKGIGHGFGMSQHMAQCLAEKGNDYIAVLSFFYPHAEIEKE